MPAPKYRAAPPGDVVTCPYCGYDPREEVERHNQGAVLCPDSPPESWDDSLDWYESLGAEGECVFCPECGRQIDVLRNRR